MEFWSNGLVATVVTLAGLLGASEVLRWMVPPLRRIGVPASIVAGVLGLLLGGSGLGLLPLHQGVLEAGVYHALGILFVAVSLQQPAVRGQTGANARAMAFGITTMVALQTVVGLAVVLALTVAAGPVHPGFGLLLPLGFEQGPGQALSLGTAWEASGLVDGGQVGLIIAAIGFGWSIFVGIPLVAWGKRRGLGWGGEGGTPEEERPHLPPESLPAGALELLSRQIVVIAAIYGVTWAICAGLSALLAPMPDIAAMVWGFHFMIAAILALAVRPLLGRLPGGTPLDDDLLARIAGVTVDFATVAALAAIQIGVLRANWVPIVLVTTVGGAVTLLASVWLARRAWPDAPFEHCVLWFGMSTGTLPTGLALLRIVDPELRSPAPVSAVLGSAVAVAFVAPIVLVLHPLAIAGSAWLALGLGVAYVAVVVGAWWRWGGLRATLRPGTIWPGEGAGG